jgi:hypothetical protein
VATALLSLRSNPMSAPCRGQLRSSARGLVGRLAFRGSEGTTGLCQHLLEQRGEVIERGLFLEGPGYIGADAGGATLGQARCACSRSSDGRLTTIFDVVIPLSYQSRVTTESAMPRSLSVY